MPHPFRGLSASHLRIEIPGTSVPGAQTRGRATCRVKHQGPPPADGVVLPRLAPSEPISWGSPKPCKPIPPILDGSEAGWFVMSGARDTPAPETKGPDGLWNERFHGNCPRAPRAGGDDGQRPRSPATALRPRLRLEMPTLTRRAVSAGSSLCFAHGCASGVRCHRRTREAAM